MIHAHLSRVSKNIFQPFLEAIDVVVDQVLSVDFALVNKANEGETFINFAQVEHDVLLVVCVGQSNNGGRLLVKFRPVFLVIVVDASHINQHVYEL